MAQEISLAIAPAVWKASFVPPKGVDWLKKPKRGLGHGYKDAFENEWIPHHPAGGQEEDFHWDVQHPDGRHTNVRPDGEIHHGQDNFP